MKITNHNSPSVSTPGLGNAQEIQKSGSGVSGTGSKGRTGNDRVEFSSTLGSLSRAMESYSSSSSSRVQALAAQYQSGTYKVDSAAISRSLVSEALGG